MTNREQWEADFPGYQTRYLAYCASQGRSPEDQKKYDRGRFPGGLMCGFIIWNSEQVGLFSKENPEHASPFLNHEKYDHWLWQGLQRLSQR